MCTDCNEITIPTGATGATGPQGPAGTNGLPGEQGFSGTTILSSYNNLTGIGTDADLFEKSLFNYSLTGGVLGGNGDEVEIFMYYTYTANDATTLRIKLGVKIITIPITNVENTINFLKVKISRISSTSQLWTIEQTTINALGSKTISLLSVDSSSLDLTLSHTFEVTGQNDISATANQLVLKKCSLYKYNF